MQLQPLRSTLFPYTTLFRSFGGIDIAINTAGKVLRKPIVDTTEEEFDTMFEINAKAAFFFIKQAGIDLNEGGKIDRKSTRLNSSHQIISYAVFCLKKKKHTL